MAISPGTASFTKTTTPEDVLPTAMPFAAIPVRANLIDCLTFILVAKIDRFNGFYNLKWIGILIILYFNRSIPKVVIMKNTFLHLVCASLMLIFSFSFAQSDEEETGLKSALNGFSFRSVGPAFMSGRIADITIDPTNENIWYVAVGSGGTWKTTNAGTTWTPLTLSLIHI